MCDCVLKSWRTSRHLEGIGLKVVNSVVAFFVNVIDMEARKIFGGKLMFYAQMRKEER